jgi:hypothetical protein
VARPSIVSPAPSRVIWRLPLPRRAILRASLALESSEVPPSPVRFRVGISDDRVYEGLDAITIPPDRRGWTELRVDLSAYAGWKWSLFYRPDRVIWHLVLAVDAASGGAVAAVWGSPEIVTDARGLREYGARRRDLLERSATDEVSMPDARLWLAAPAHAAQRASAPRSHERVVERTITCGPAAKRVETLPCVSAFSCASSLPPPPSPRGPRPRPWQMPTGGITAAPLNRRAIRR